MAPKPKYRDDVISTAEQDALMASPELRAERQARHLSELPDPKKPLRGRKRAPLVGVELLPIEFSRVISTEALEALKKALIGKQPIFDKFTDHYHFDPKPEKVESFVMAGNKNNSRLKIKTEENANRTLIRANMRRQTQELAGNVVRGTFDDLNTARLRRASLYVTRYQIETGQPLDKPATTVAADAVIDFGNGLAYKNQKQLLRDTHQEHLAENIIYIGEVAKDDPGILAENLGLVGIVQSEQIARCDYWRPRFEVADSHLRRPKDGQTRLLETDLQNGIELEQELQRLQGLVSGVAFPK